MAAPTPEQIAAIANAGPGSLSDRAKVAKGAFAFDNVTAKNYGAGFVPDLFRMVASQTPPPPLYSTSVENISNANPATVKVSAAAFPNFPPNTLVAFAGTGNALLDSPQRPPYAVTSSNDVGKTFKIDLDLRSAPAPIITGTVSQAVYVVTAEAETGKAAPETIKTLLSDPPPAPEPRATVQEANGYEQAVADAAK